VADVFDCLIRAFIVELKGKRLSYPFYGAMTFLFNYQNPSIHQYHYQLSEVDLQKNITKA